MDETWQEHEDKVAASTEPWWKGNPDRWWKEIYDV